MKAQLSPVCKRNGRRDYYALTPVPAVETSNARITRRTGRAQNIPATHRATSFEGGVRHDYIGKGVRITYHDTD